MSRSRRTGGRIDLANPLGHPRARRRAPILKATPESIARAASILRDGGLVAIPTETVYGLAADAGNARAVARLYEVKGRPRFNPLIAHVSGPDMAAREARLEGMAAFAAGFYWPGPLSLVLPVLEGATVCALARAGLPTLALRHPSHSVAHDLINALGRPLVAPSANLSGRISPVTAAAVADELGASIDLILDGGRCPVGVESTVVSFAGETPALLRPGGTETAALERFLGVGLARPGDDRETPGSPGQLARHYAPRASLRLNADWPGEGEAFLGFGPIAATSNLSVKGDLAEAAANLFPMLRELDREFGQIAVAPIPGHGLGEAINDRLTRAAQKAH